MKREVSSIVLDIIDSIEKLLSIIDEFDLDKLEVDWKLQDIVVRRFEIMGEASGRISKTTKEKYPDISWQLMKSMRNKLIHNYDGISFKVVYQTIKEFLPSELEKLKKIDLNNI